MGRFIQATCPVCNRPGAPKMWHRLADSRLIGHGDGPDWGVEQFAGGRGDMTTLGHFSSFDDDSELEECFREVIAPRSALVTVLFLDLDILNPVEVVEVLPERVLRLRAYHPEFSRDSKPDYEEWDEEVENVAF